MPITIGSNIASLQVQRNLGRATDGVSRSFERLSSGLRINRASDDPAGLAVSSALNFNSRVLGRARLNINDAVSTLAIAEGGLDQMSNLLIRMQELAEQAANGAVSRTQRTYLAREYQQLDLEIRRLSKTTSFNSMNFLEGQKSGSNSGIVVDGASIPLLYGLSANGRYYVYDDGSAPRRYDNDTRTSVALSLPSNTSGYAQALVTNSGDVAFTAPDNTTSIADVYYYSNQTNSTRKLTHSLSVNDATVLTLSDDGSTIAFNSDTIYQNGGTASSYSAGANQRLYFVDTETAQIRATTTNLGSTIQSLQLSSDGRYLAANFGGNLGIYAADRDSTSSTVSSYAPGANLLIGVGTNGKAYFSSTLNLAGQNSALARQIYTLDVASQSVTQESQFTPNGAFRAARLSTDGNTIFFVSSSNYGESPSVARQLYAYDLVGGGLEMRTSYTNGAEGAISANAITGAPFISADGAVVMSQDSTTNDIHRATLRPTSTTLDFETGFGNTGKITTTLSSTFDAIRGLGAYALTSASGARAALDGIKDNLNRLNLLRGNIGAGQSRLEYAHSLTTGQQMEFVAAASRISDADIAAEAAELTKKQIIQRSAASLLAQANQQPALALQLLKRR